MLCRPLLGGRGVARRKRYVLDVRLRNGRRDRRRIDKRVLVGLRVTIGFDLATSFRLAGRCSAVLGTPSGTRWRFWSPAWERVDGVGGRGVTRGTFDHGSL